MKKLLLSTLILFVVGIGSTIAQTVDEEIKLIQEAFGKDKKTLVEAYMNLSPEKANSFWPLYEAFEVERKKIGKERILIINEYIEKFTHIGDAEADNLATRSLKNDAALNKLYTSYYSKFKKATSAIDAAKFIQIEFYITNTIRNAIQQELPFIGEI
jgi:D-alanine-D-alanine ligase-like ATP-grasp enzyme